MVLNAILNPLLRPLLVLGDFWAMTIITLLVSLIVTVIYKYVTDQAMMKQLKDDLKQLQQKAKEHKGDSGKMMKVQKEMMDKNMVLMKHSFKPTLITFLPLILIMGWLQTNMAFDPIPPDTVFSVAVAVDKDFAGIVELLDTPNVVVIGDRNQTPRNRMAIFDLKAPEGMHSLQFSAGGTPFGIDAVVSAGREYGEQTKSIKRNGIRQISVSYPKNILLDLGFLKLGWIGTYIVLSLIFSIGLRKVLKVY